MKQPATAIAIAIAALGCAALVTTAGPAWAQDVPLTGDEFQSTFVGKPVKWDLDGRTYQVVLDPGGKATVSGPYNDVGKWRSTGPASYCTAWNKQSPTESCISIVKRGGEMIGVRPDGVHRGTVVGAK